jgi:cell division protein FtsB
MANRGARTRFDGALRRVRLVARVAGRVLTAAGIVLVVSLVIVQFARAIGENLAAGHELSVLRSDIGSLERQREDQERELRRLRDPQGAIPEIHDRLRLVRPNEQIIFISPAPSAGP